MSDVAIVLTPLAFLAAFGLYAQLRTTQDAYLHRPQDINDASFHFGLACAAYALLALAICGAQLLPLGNRFGATQANATALFLMTAVGITLTLGLRCPPFRRFLKRHMAKRAMN